MKDRCDIFEIILPDIDPFSEQVGCALNFILKNWDSNKESFDEFRERMFKKERTDEKSL